MVLIFSLFFARYARRAAAVLARAGIRRATVIERFTARWTWYRIGKKLPLSNRDTPIKRLPCLHEHTFAGRRTLQFTQIFMRKIIHYHDLNFMYIKIIDIKILYM